MKCPCEKYDKRVAIMTYDGGMDPFYARKQARQDVCKGCEGKLGIGLFDVEREGK